jgi:hypothetical protein
MGVHVLMGVQARQPWVDASESEEEDLPWLHGGEAVAVPTGRPTGSYSGRPVAVTPTATKVWL